MLKQRFYDLYTKDDLQAMYATMTQEELSQKTGFCTRQIYRYLKKWDIEKRARGRSCPWHALDVDDEFMNYFGGFLYADGSLNKTSHTGYTLGLILSKKDECIINTLQSGIEGAGKISEVTSHDSPQIGFHLHGIDLADKLLKFGVTTNKRYGWTRPQITDSMLPHFLRGWYDGDGYIGKDGAHMILTNINEEAIRYFEEMIRYLGYSGHGRKQLSGSGLSRVYMNKVHTMGKLGKNRDVWRHSISGKSNCKQMYHLLKGDSTLRLDRKWKLLNRL